MPGIAVTKCITSTGCRNEDGVLGGFLRSAQILTAAASILALPVVVVVSWYAYRIHKYCLWLFGPGITVVYTLRQEALLLQRDRTRHLSV